MSLKQHEGATQETDRKGGSFIVESGADRYTIELAYTEKSSGGALGLHLHLKSDSALLKTAIYVTSGDAKGNKTYYTDKKDPNVTHNLPGFNLGESLCQLTVGQDLDTVNNAKEEKVVKLWDFNAGAEMPKTVDALTMLHGQEIVAGVLKSIEDKKSKGDDGQYHPTGQTIEKNEIDKFFSADTGMTMTEQKHCAKSGETIADEEKYLNATWIPKNQGNTQDNSTKGASGAVEGAPAAAATTSLFGKPAA